MFNLIITDTKVAQVFFFDDLTKFEHTAERFLNKVIRNFKWIGTNNFIHNECYANFKSSFSINNVAK